MGPAFYSEHVGEYSQQKMTDSHVPARGIIPRESIRRYKLQLQKGRIKRDVLKDLRIDMEESEWRRSEWTEYKPSSTLK
jgi:hypothetical protein